MPRFKNLNCWVERSDNNVHFPESQTTYGDHRIETYVAVPANSTPFSIRLKSDGYIAPGLAMYVYIDGDYQCNRNRQNLMLPDEATERGQIEVDFQVRQKEEQTPQGTLEAKEWRFEKQDKGMSNIFFIHLSSITCHS